MAADHAGPAGEAKPGDEYRFAAGLGDGDAAVVDGQIVDEPDEVLGTIVSDDGSPTFEKIRFRLSATKAVSPGEFVAAEGRDRDGTLASWVLCRVLDAHEINPHEDPQSATVRDVLPFPGTYAPEGESTIIYRLVRCEPVEELPAADGGTGDPAEIRTLPRAGDLVRRPRPDMITAVMGFRPTLSRACMSGTCTATPRSRSPSTTARCSGTC